MAGFKRWTVLRDLKLNTPKAYFQRTHRLISRRKIRLDDSNFQRRRSIFDTGFICFFFFFTSPPAPRGPRTSSPTAKAAWYESLRGRPHGPKTDLFAGVRSLVRGGGCVGRGRPFATGAAAAAAASAGAGHRRRWRRRGRRRRLGRRGCQPTGVEIHGHRHHDPEGG